MVKVLKTPCIGVCSTGIGDSVCRGCKRFAHEVIGWNNYNSNERELIFARLNGFLDTVVQAKIEVRDENILAGFIVRQGIPMTGGESNFAKVFSLLKAGAQQLDTLDVVGCEVRAAYRHLTLVELRDEIDKDFYTLSCAHYERYFPH